MKRITAFLLACVMLASCLNVLATETYENNETIEILPSVLNDSTGEIRLVINVPEGFSGKELSVYVFNPKVGDENGYGISDIKLLNPIENAKVLQYYAQKTVSETTVTVDFKLRPQSITDGTKPKYNIYAALDSQNFGKGVIFYYDSASKLALLAGINNKTANKETLAEDVCDYFTLQAFDVKEIAQNSLKHGENILKLANSAATEGNIESIYKQAAILTSAYEGNTAALIENIGEYNDTIGLESKYVSEIANIKTAGLTALNNSVKKDYESISDYSAALKNAILTAEIYYYKDDGSGHFLNLLSNFKSDFEALGVDYALYDASNKTAVAKAVIGAGYVEPIRLAEKINYYAVANPLSSGGSSSGGGGSAGGGSSSGGGSGSGSAALFVPSATPSETQPIAVPTVFLDLQDVKWAESYITRLYNGGIVNGDGNGKFLPNNNITRREFVKMIVEAFNIEQGEKSVLFYDVSAKDWAYSFISRAASWGIVTGYNGNFSPSTNITRQDLAVMLVRSLKAKDKLPSVTDRNTGFGDKAKIADYALESVSILYKNGIIGGDEKGNFMPESFATRAEAAKMLCGILDMIEE